MANQWINPLEKSKAMKYQTPKIEILDYRTLDRPDRTNTRDSRQREAMTGDKLAILRAQGWRGHLTANRRVTGIDKPILVLLDGFTRSGALDVLVASNEAIKLHFRNDPKTGEPAMDVPIKLPVLVYEDLTLEEEQEVRLAEASGVPLDRIGWQRAMDILFNTYGPNPQVIYEKGIHFLLNNPFSTRSRTPEERKALLESPKGRHSAFNGVVKHAKFRWYLHPEARLAWENGELGKGPKMESDTIDVGGGTMEKELSTDPKVNPEGYLSAVKYSRNTPGPKYMVWWNAWKSEAEKAIAAGKPTDTVRVAPISRENMQRSITVVNSPVLKVAYMIALGQLQADTLLTADKLLEAVPEDINEAFRALATSSAIQESSK